MSFIAITPKMTAAIIAAETAQIVNNVILVLNDFSLPTSNF